MLTVDKDIIKRPDSANSAGQNLGLNKMESQGGKSQTDEIEPTMEGETTLAKLDDEFTAMC